jgi:hypothetical protein
VPRPRNWPPTVHHRRDRGTDFTIINGKRYTLGEHGSAESRQEYLRLVAEAEANGGRPLPERTVDITVVEVVAAYTAYAETIYDQQQLCRVQSAFRPLIE